MSYENVIKFGQMVMNDAALRSELQGRVAGLDVDAAAAEAARFATGKGYPATADEVKEGYATLVGGGGKGELSDAQLETVAGGKGKLSSSQQSTGQNPLYNNGVLAPSGGGGKGGGK